MATHLSLLSDRRLGEVVAAADPLGTGIGGRSAELDIDGTRVFVKRVPLTETELRPENARSTANLFGLPTFYQYGVGSAGFGAWRELAVHVMTTNWVLGNEYEGFPLMYHWRILPDSPPEGFADAFGGIDGAVVHWEGSSAVRERLEAIGRSSSSLVLFLEHVPQTLADWLHDYRTAAPEGGEGSPYPWVEEALARGSAFMSSRGLVHFDAHFANVLTDGQLLYFADFGLALSSDFELSAAEAEFLSDHLVYDRCDHRPACSSRCGHGRIRPPSAHREQADAISGCRDRAGLGHCGRGAPLRPDFGRRSPSGRLGMGGVLGAEAASQFEALALGGFEGLLQGLDLVAVPSPELGELGCEGAYDAAGRVLGRLRGRPWGGASLLGPQLFDASSEFGAAVEEVERDVGGLGEAAEGDGLSVADHLPQVLLGAGLGSGALAGGGLAEVVGVSTHAGQLLSWLRVIASVRASTPAPRTA